MARRPSYTRRVPELLESLRQGTRDQVFEDGRSLSVRIPQVLGTEHLGGLLGLSERQASRLLSQIGIRANGKAFVITREDLARYLIQLYHREGGDAKLGKYRQWLERGSAPSRSPAQDEAVRFEEGRMVVSGKSWRDITQEVAKLVGRAKKEPHFVHDVNAALSGGRGGEGTDA